MTEQKPKLSDFSANTYSQFGEDGIIAKIFEIIHPQNRVCVEFGAWEGFHLSNTANLWTKGWKGILIESDKEKFKTLQEKTKPYDCICINEYIAPEGDSSVDSILRNQGIEKVDLISIDVDGDDYLIFEKLKTKARVVVCEYNPTIPKDIRLTSKIGAHFGCSSLSLVDLAKTLGYSLVCMTDCNCIFVVDEEFHKFSSFETDYHAIAPEKHLTYFITDFSGNYALTQPPLFGQGKPLDIHKINSTRELFVELSPKSILKRSPIKKIVASAKKIKHMALWVLKLTTKPPHSVKIKNLKKLAQRYKLNYFIETGTYKGDTINAIHKYFTKVHSIEIDENLYRSAYKKFASVNKIKLHRGDSGSILNEILRDLSEPALFWLDGHYSGGITGRGTTDTPIKEELVAVLSHPIKTHAIAIDDARLFNGTNGYPTIAQIQEMLRNDGNNYKLTTNDDIIIVEPNILSNLKKS